MQSDEKICERCHQVKRTPADVCPDDGGKLHAIQDEHALLGRVIDGKLTLNAVLGKGGMGVVYRARQHSMDREVAVKVLHPGFSNDAESVRRFLHEARAATRLEHPNVITVFDFGRTDDGLLYIVMELLGGRSLGAEIDLGPIAPARAVYLLAQIADAVHHAHERGLVHRDLKPENVVLVQGSALRGDFVKVLDFGIATMRSYDGIERITRTGAVCGTPAYMSPEQVLGDEVDRRSDVYALGLIAYEMLTGVHPLPADTPMRQMLAHLEKPIPSFASVAAGIALPPSLEAAIQRALAKKRDERTESALAFANELVAALGGDAALVGLAPSSSSRPPVSESVRAKSTPVSGLQPDRSARGFADTARATALPTPTPAKWRGVAPYFALGMVLLVAIIFLATRSDAPSGEPSHPNVAGGAPPLTVPAPTPKVEPAPDPKAGASVGSAARDGASVGSAARDGANVGSAARDVASVAHVAAPHALDPRGARGSLDGSPPVAVASPDTQATQVPQPDTAGADRATTPDPTPDATTPPAPKTIAVTTQPLGASVLVDGVEIGVTPLDVPLPASGVTRSIVLKKNGYRPETRTLAHDSADLQLTLKRHAVGPRSDAPPIVR